MSYWDEYETDREAELGGKWFEFKGGLKLKIARADPDANPSFGKRLQDAQANPENQDEGKAAEAMIKLYATLVTDAKGLLTRQGKSQAYSNKNIVALFVALPELYKEVQRISNTFDNYKLTRAIDDLKK